MSKKTRGTARKAPQWFQPINWSLWLLIGFLQYQIWLAPSGMPRVREQQANLTQKDYKIALLTKQNEELKEDIAHLKVNEGDSELYARQELGLIKPGEHLFIVSSGH